MSSYTQANRPLKVFTPLGPDALLPIGVEGREAVSELFRYELDLLAEKSRAVPFERLIGQKVSVEMTLFDGAVRHFHGIVSELSEGDGDEIFAHYRMTLAPAFWRLTKRVRFRIFQGQSVPDILKQVLAGLDVRFHVVGEYRPRNFCVQYQESDFAFASRLMEEEGIFYYFEHRGDGHTLVVSDQSPAQPDIAGPSQLRFEPRQGGRRREDSVASWRKSQQLCSGKFTCWDYNFQMPDKHLETTSAIQDQVPVGKAAHHLDAGANKDLEVFQFTGSYGGHYDSLDAGGADRERMLPYLFEDSKKLARLRMEQEASQSVRIEGSSDCGRFLPGRHFTLIDHAHADGGYLLTRVGHHVRQAGYRPGEEIVIEYHNDFAALPKNLPFRPPRVTPAPQAHGLQTAVVVGPKDEEIFTDKFGRVKVQFFWDRDGKHDPNSSCWVRVAQPHAGKGFGFISIPRVGEEVVVGFGGDNPDRPLIIGRVYNAQNMPPYELPKHRSWSGLKSHSCHGDALQYSGLCINDQPGQEQLNLQAERDMLLQTNQNHVMQVGGCTVVHYGANNQSAARSGSGGGALYPLSPGQPTSLTSTSASGTSSTTPSASGTSPTSTSSSTNPYVQTTTIPSGTVLKKIVTGNVEAETIGNSWSYQLGSVVSTTVEDFNVIYLLRQVCAALREVHEAGLVHRDIKPVNLFVCQRGCVRDVVKLLDFGIVQLAPDAPRAEHLTMEGKFLGTPSFVSPEQIRAKEALDGRSDLYSLGAVAYFLLTGQPPFLRDTPPEVFAAHLRDAPVPPSRLDPSIPRDLEAVVLRCLEKDPAQRYADAAALSEQLSRCAAATNWTEAQAEAWWRQCHPELLGKTI